MGVEKRGVRSVPMKSRSCAGPCGSVKLNDASVTVVVRQWVWMKMFFPSFASFVANKISVNMIPLFSSHFPAPFPAPFSSFDPPSIVDPSQTSNDCQNGELAKKMVLENINTRLFVCSVGRCGLGDCLIQ